jgi:hypothetical protein
MHEVEEREEVVHAEHTPLYSWAPLVIGAGIFFLNLGFVFGLPVGLFGLAVLLGGVAVWVREDVHLWAAGSDEHGGH